MQALDRADKAISRLVFRARLPLVVEYALSPVWVFHGCPVTALALCPWLIVVLTRDSASGSVVDALVDQAGLAWGACTAIIVTLFLWIWRGLITAGTTNSIYMHGQKVAMVVLILSSIVAIRAFDAVFGGTRHNTNVVSFYLCSWFMAEAIVVTLKALAGRLRPGVSLAAELDGVPRALTGLTYLRAGGETATQSFPSGDATGGAVFATTLALRGVPATTACFYAVLVAFGRMYLWAHHLGDVIAGCSIGTTCTAGLDAVRGADTFGLLHVVASAGLILTVYSWRSQLQQSANRVQ